MTISKDIVIKLTTSYKIIRNTSNHQSQNEYGYMPLYSWINKIYGCATENDNNRKKNGLLSNMLQKTAAVRVNKYEY
jgi:hypothetical protein